MAGAPLKLRGPVTRADGGKTGVGKGYGGLEHRASTSLLASRNDLPGAQTPTEGDRKSVV